MRRHVQDSKRLVGSQLEVEVILREFVELSAPLIGDKTIATRLLASTAILPGEDINITVLLWSRGALVATVGVFVFDPTDLLPALTRLARLMNGRIDDVLEGKTVTSNQTSSPAPVPPSSSAPVDPAKLLDLSAMVLTLEDLPSDVVTDTEGPRDKSDAVQAYERRFKAKDEFMAYDSSEITEVRAVVWEYSHPQGARAAIDILKEQGVQAVQRQALESAGATANVALIETFDIPRIGDVSLALSSSPGGASSTVQGVVVHFARDRVRAQLFVVGTAGKIAVDDVARLAQLFDKKIERNLQ